MGQPCFEKASAHRRDRLVDARASRVCVFLVVAERLEELEMFLRRAVEEHVAVEVLVAIDLDVVDRKVQIFVDVMQDGA